MRSKDRQYIPTMPARPAPSPSLWQRLRSVASSAIATVRTTAGRVVAFVTRKTTGARRALARVARAAMVRRPWVLTRDGVKHVAETVHMGNRAAAVRVANWFRFQRKYAPRKVSSWTKDTWRRVIHPFMRVRVTVLGIGAVVVGLAVAPMTTLAVLAACGAMLFGLSRLIRRLEDVDHSAARAALCVIEIAAQVLCVAAYIAAGAIVLAFSAASAAFAVTEVLELVLRYLDVPFAVSLAALTFFVLTANWGFGAIEVAWLVLVHETKAPTQATRSHAQDRQAIPLIRVGADHAWNDDQIADEAAHDAVRPVQVAKCMGCDLEDAGPRFGFGNMTSLCSDCFEYLAEDELVLAVDRGEVSAKDVAAAVQAGVKVPAYVVITTGARLRNTRIDLDREAITCRTKARVLSEQDPSRIHWAETAWWFDGRGERRARRWHGFVDGHVATFVEYKHEKDVRGFYTEIGDVRFKTLSGAQDAAADEIADRKYEDDLVVASASNSRPRVVGAAS